MTIINQIRDVIERELSPQILEIKDQSHLHKGHAAYRENQVTHLKMIIVADCFEGMKLVARQRKINELMKPFFDSGLHALELITKTVKDI